MSTVVEAIAANHMGMKICGVSFVANLAAGISPTPLTHDEVQAAAAKAAPQFKKLVTDTVIKIGQRCL
jgi:purine-nucleoside phosphorylase